jgi:hypothetical protein
VTNAHEGTLFVDQNGEFEMAAYVRGLFPLFSVQESAAAAAAYSLVGSPVEQVTAIVGECQSPEFIS